MECNSSGLLDAHYLEYNVPLEEYVCSSRQCLQLLFGAFFESINALDVLKSWETYMAKMWNDANDVVPSTACPEGF
jgi:hypothetical protein